MNVCQVMQKSVRNILRNKLHSILNLTGLIIGLVVFSFSYLYVKHEMSFDREWRVFFDALEPPWPKHGPRFDRVYVPEISVRDMFDDAFTAIARDGAGVVEVAVRLQKALHSLASIGDSKMRDAAEYHSRLALKRARNALDISEDLAAVQDAAMFSTTSRSSYNQATSSLARD